MKNKINIFDAEHPLRKLAIKILEELAEKQGNPKQFDDNWYAYEDLLVEILNGFKNIIIKKEK